MITLYGAALSPYYNKVKLAMLEKGVNFTEVMVRPSRDPEFLAKSPLGKIPAVEINGLFLAESTPILEWLEDAYPTLSLLPPTPNSRALARELASFIDLALIPACAPLQRHLVWGEPLPEREALISEIQHCLAALLRRGRCLPWLAGDFYSVADVSAATILPLLGAQSRAALGIDVLENHPLAAYIAQLRQRPTVARILADRETLAERFIASRQRKA